MKNMANQFLGLSLFIMLLAFFIILNSISTYEDTKSRPVLNSLIVAFSNREPVDVLPPGPMDMVSETQNLGSTLDKLESLFSAQITAADTRQNRLGTIMYVRAPFDDFRDAITSSLSGAPAPLVNPLDEQNIDLLPMLVSLLETDDAVPYKMDMILNVEQEPSALLAESPEQFVVHNNAVSAIARKVTESGLPTRQITVGIGQGEPGFINLVFRRYEPFNPVNAIDIENKDETETETEEAPSEEEGQPL